MDTVGAIVNLVASITGGSAIVAVTTALSGRRRVTAEAEHLAAQADGTVVATTRELLKGVTEEIARVRADMRAVEDRCEQTEREKRELEGEVGALRRQVRAYRARVDYLTTRIVAAAIEVTEWEPPDE